MKQSWTCAPPLRCIQSSTASNKVLDFPSSQPSQMLLPSGVVTRCKSLKSFSSAFGGSSCWSWPLVWKRGSVVPTAIFSCANIFFLSCWVSIRWLGISWGNRSTGLSDTLKMERPLFLRYLCCLMPECLRNFTEIDGRPSGTAYGFH